MTDAYAYHEAFAWGTDAYRAQIEGEGGFVCSTCKKRFTGQPASVGNTGHWWAACEQCLNAWLATRKPGDLAPS